ncbi:PD-(D/E)XK motif protein [Mariniplasma anaerobium]|uniref:PD-(D/E)XK motif protein n=1 Tax=Mariniplasma anaerobium TaxID=2735436 RepID=A0A7U9XVU8_9MOLU|nr:PD-(D/E)XK motif protein [Mariniplasma anaerobium]BCR35707.1 hypothetical protein MPAN_006000 [Mariniplasma anaerobium]
MDNKKLVNKYFETIAEDDKMIKLLLETENYSIGKRKSNICFIVKSDGGQNRRFKNGDMSISINSRYIVSGVEGLYSIIFYHNEEEKKIEIFIDALVSFASTNTVKSDDLLTLYNEISEVFKKIDFDYNKFIGNIGELLFIKHIYDYHKINMVNYYKGSDLHLVDFEYKDINFEIKTSISDQRKHHINNDQLIGNGYLCSVLVKEQNNGMSIEEIYNNIKSLFICFPSKKAYFENYLLSVPINYSNLKVNTSVEKIRFYSFLSIPKFVNYHEAISNIRFICNLSNLTFVTIEALF